MLPGPLVDAGWLAARLGRPGLVVADVRWRLGDPDHGRRCFAERHLPGAVRVDLDRDLSRPAADPSEGRHPLPTPEAFAATLARLGIADGDSVVAYDDAAGSVAARLWWMLAATGRDAAVLDGGIAAWAGPWEQGEGGPTPVADPPPEVRPWPDRLLATTEEVAAGRCRLLDGRAPARHRGDEEPVDPRPGRIPGSLNVPAATLVDDGGRLLPAEDLARLVGGEDVVASCGSGVTACALLLARAAAGLTPGRLYVASYSGWSSEPSRPVATG